ncbi:MAG: DUF2279 domain-containing protein [Sulfurimonadaceae bacterium]|nr:DUF2279 domain-containing protein [Sulfurimonadaceae bacterium]
MRYLLGLLLSVSILFGDNVFSDEKGKKLLYTNLAAAGAIVAWGYWQWDYGERGMHMGDEGWFESDTEHGGADKLGHTYATYAVTRAVASLYRDYGYDDERAARYAAYSSFFINTIMEVGDAFSSYGFSKEDFVMNTLGSYLGYLFERNKELDELVDIRLEYFPSSKVREGEVTDIVTDYDGMKFLAAFKCDAMEPFQDNPMMKYLEFHVGYYTRGNHENAPERTVYLGLGLNLSKLLDGRSSTAETLLEYYQVPFTYLPYEHDYDR